MYVEEENKVMRLKTNDQVICVIYFNHKANTKTESKCKQGGC